MSRVEWPATQSVTQWLSGVQSALSPGSAIQKSVRDDIRRIAVQDHERKMLTGITKDGLPRAPLSARTLANPKRGPGPSLVPRGRQSRYITQYRVQWEQQGNQNRWAMSMRFDWFTSKTGFPIPLAHEHGVRSRNLPARPVMGLTPEGLREIAARINKVASMIAAGGK